MHLLRLDIIFGASISFILSGTYSKKGLAPGNCPREASPSQPTPPELNPSHELATLTMKNVSHATVLFLSCSLTV